MMKNLNGMKHSVKSMTMKLVALLLVVGLLTTSEATKASKTAKSATFRRVLLRLDTVQDALGLSLVVDARVIAPTVRGEDEGGDEV